MGEAAEHIAAKCGVSARSKIVSPLKVSRCAAAAWERGAFRQGNRCRHAGSGAQGEGRQPRRRNTARHNDGSAGEAETGVPRRRHSHGRQRLDAERWRRSRTGRLGARAERLGVKPMARVVAYATSGVAPKDIFIAPVLAVRQVLEKAKWKIGDVDLIELNEAFAAQMLACDKELGLDESKVNVNGGAIALGHPIGALVREC